MIKLRNLYLIGNRFKRTMVSTAPDFLVQKENYLNRSDESRGGHTVAEIDTWETYFNSDSDRLLAKRGKGLEYQDRYNIASYPINPQLNKRVSIFRGDITSLQVDAIVNAANKSLLGGGGVDGAIHRSAGKYLLAECKTLQGCDTGKAKITGGYQLPAKYIIHTVGPIGENPPALESCYDSTLRLAVANNISTIAFPCISTGVYGYPQTSAAVVALNVVRRHLENNPFERVIFCLFLPEDVEIYETLMQLYFPVVKQN